MMRNVCLLVCLVAIVACATTSSSVVSVPNRTEDVADSGLVPQSAGRLFGHANRQDDAAVQGRTFGLKRRIQFLFMPMIYKMGVIMTMLAVLTAISLKSLMIGSVLLVLKLSTILAKFYSAWQPQGYVHGHEWSSPHQPVHVHVHGEQYHHQAYAGQLPYDDKHYYYK